MSGFNGDIGPCVVIWDPDGDNVTINKTEGGVIFHWEENKVDVKEDQQGETPVDKIAVGAICELTVPITRENPEKLVHFFMNAERDGDSMKVSNPVGGASFADAKEVIVKRIVNGVVSVTASEWIHIHRASPRVNLEHPFDNSSQRKATVVFEGFPDDASGQVSEMWRAGEDF